MTQDVSRPAGAGSAPAPLIDGGPRRIHIRPVSSRLEFAACAALQAEVWGSEYNDAVPASIMQVATKYVGGLVLGAFTDADELVGFLFGLTGVDDGEIVHWSHMLGVRDVARDLGIGRMLKEAQRAELAARGIHRMSWTFDPLVAKNAYLNLNRLGARVTAYVPNLYGASPSPRHYGIATDRLIVTLDTRAAAPPADAFTPSLERLPVLTPALQDDDVAVDFAAPPPELWIEIPADFALVMEKAPTDAVAWRETVRANFQWALGLDYEVIGLQRDAVSSRSFYLLRRKGGA
jgi:predicted GNAT superfamily acetyltransferase